MDFGDLIVVIGGCILIFTILSVVINDNFFVVPAYNDFCEESGFDGLHYEYSGDKFFCYRVEEDGSVVYSRFKVFDGKLRFIKD